jgi:DNA-binding MarR family transcriptional regulator
VNDYTLNGLWQTSGVKRPSGAALLLSQIGAHVSAEFTRRLAPLGLRPAHVGILRVLALRPGLSQQELASAIGAVPSRVVKLLDELSERGLVERRRSTADRRNHELHLSPSASDRLLEVREVVSEHDEAVIAGLSADETQTLLRLLNKIAKGQGMASTGHPGYRTD